MSYTVEAIDVTKNEKVVDPRSKGKKETPRMYKWWLSENDNDLTAQGLSTVEFLKRTNANRIRQASVFSRLFSGKPLSNYLAANATLDTQNQLPIGRPTANVVYSCTDTLYSRIPQDKPKPVFLTDGGDYKQQQLAEQANAFLQGELFRMKAYDKGALALRDACVLGDAFIKVCRKDDKVALERTLATELLVDFNDGYYYEPRQIWQLKLVDRSVALEMFGKKEALVEKATSGHVDSTPRSTDTISDQIILAEGWHLRSGEGAKDGRHVIICSEGSLLDEDWDKDYFPFAKFGYNPNMVNYFSQSLAEILMPIQMELYRMLIVASQSIELMGVPRIYIDELSKITETSFNNRIGTIIKGRGTPPTFLNAISNPPEIYEWIQWLIQLSYNMAGVSALSAQGVKPQGLNSGEAQREFMQNQDIRFNALSDRYRNIYIDLSYLIIEEAKEIAESNGKYETTYPGKDGAKEINFKEISKLVEDTYIIQCFEESSLPKDPAGRQAKISEMLAAGEITKSEFRRLSSFPDIKESDQEAFAREDRIRYCIQHIIDNGKKDYDKIQPDNFMLDPEDTATTLVVAAINRYSRLKLEDEKMQLLRDWFTQVQALKQAAMPPPQVDPNAQPQNGSQLPPTAPPQAPIGPASGVAV